MQAEATTRDGPDGDRAPWMKLTEAATRLRVPVTTLPSQCDNHQVALLVTGRRPETGTTSNPFLLRDLRARRPVYLDHHQGT